MAKSSVVATAVCMLDWFMEVAMKALRRMVALLSLLLLVSAFLVPVPVQAANEVSKRLRSLG